MSIRGFGSGSFWKWEAHAEPCGTRHGAFVPLFHPAAGVCLPQAGRRAQRKINIVKLTHYCGFLRIDTVGRRCYDGHLLNEREGISAGRKAPPYPSRLGIHG